LEYFGTIGDFTRGVPIMEIGKMSKVASLVQLACLACLPLRAAQAPQPKTHRVTLKWNAPAAHARPAAVGYNIYRSEHKGGPYTAIAKGVRSLTYTDAKVRSGQTYYYKVTGVAANGRESTAATISAAVP
jgi:fibronectin type 3 domain-containing protein